MRINFSRKAERQNSTNIDDKDLMSVLLTKVYIYIVCFKTCLLWEKFKEM